MADNSKIEWTDATWNPITGCSVVSAGCKHCYAMKLAGTRMKHHPSRAGLTVDTSAGPVWNGEVRLNSEWMSQPIGWTRQRMVFVCAHSDLFHPAVSDDWIDSVFGVMWACLYNRKGEPGHIFQVLTKRPERMRQYFSTDRREKWAHAATHYGGGIDPDGLYDQTANFEGSHPRIWLGVSVENQAAADERIPLLLQTPAAVRWISAEPLLGSVDFSFIPRGIVHGYHQTGNFWEIGCDSCRGWRGYDDDLNDKGECPVCGASDSMIERDESRPGIDWVVAGGESGPHARPMRLEWARSLRDQCAAADVSFLFKQWGEYAPKVWTPYGIWDMESTVMEEVQSGRALGPAEVRMIQVGKKHAGRLLDGVTHDGYPE